MEWKTTPKNSPKFIVFEGIDGSGKTLQLSWFSAWLQKKGYRVFLTEEPMRESATGHFVKIALRSKEKYPPEVYLLLFLQDRINHIENYIKPALKDGKIVLSDRYHFSTLAYQTAQGLEREKIDGVLKALRYEILLPDLTVFIDVPVEVALERIYGRTKGTVDIYEKEEFLKRVRENYLELAKEFGFLVIDGDRDPEEIHEEIVKKVGKFYP